MKAPCRSPSRPAAHSERPFPLIAEHVLLARAGSILEAHERLAPAVDRALLEEVVGIVPADWLTGVGEDPEVYVDYMSRRARSGAFAAEAERARADA